MCLRSILDASYLLAQGFCFLVVGIIEIIIGLAISRVVWILVILGTAGSLAIFGLTNFLRAAANPSQVHEEDIRTNLTALNYNVSR